MLRGDQHIKGCESQIFKSRSKSTMKRSWNETWRDYRRLQKIIEEYFQILQKKKICFVKVMRF